MKMREAFIDCIHKHDCLRILIVLRRNFCSRIKGIFLLGWKEKEREMASTWVYPINTQMMAISNRWLSIYNYALPGYIDLVLLNSWLTRFNHISELRWLEISGWWLRVVNTELTCNCISGMQLLIPHNARCQIVRYVLFLKELKKRPLHRITVKA